MPMILADGIKKWLPRRKPKVMKGLPLNPNAAIEFGYYGALYALIAPMTRETEAAFIKLFRQPQGQAYFAQDSGVSDDARAIMQALIEKFQAIFNLAAPPLAQKMTHQSAMSSASSLQRSLKQLSGGLTLKTDILTGELEDVFTATVAENVSLIKSIASEYLTQVQGAVMRSISTGRGLADLIPYLQKEHGVTLNRARVIARDQTKKAFSNINFARMDKLGINEYEWLHSAGGQKPRPLHVRMSGKFYRINDPPVIDEKTGQRGKPGDLINCRCRSIPVIRFEEA